MDKPKIFISSTIYDFRDLRSALKFYLESLGHQVLLSEFNDFTKDLNRNSFDACLKTITQVDYYILLVGSRVGGFYDIANRISITQKEYKTAYEFAKAGRLKMLMFVREDLWNVRTDRKSLEKFLAGEFKEHHELSEGDTKKITYHESEIVNDAGFLFDFIDEITRKHEMVAATAGTGKYPLANWVHKFSSFNQIVDALTVEFGFEKSLNEVALIFNLRHELTQNLMTMCTKDSSGDLFFDHDYARSARNYFNGNFDTYSSIPSKHLKVFAVYLLFGFGRQANMQTKFIDYALMSGQFMEYDVSHNSYRLGKIGEGLKRLSGQIQTYQSILNIIKPIQMSLIDRYAKSPMSDDLINVPNQDLFSAFVGYSCLCNIKELIIGVLKAFDGDASYLDVVSLIPNNPSVEMSEAVKRESVTRDEIEQYVKTKKQPG